MALDFLNNVKLNSYYKVLLCLSVILMIISLSVKTEVVSNEILFKTSRIILIATVVLWLIDEIFEKIANYYELKGKEDRWDDSEYMHTIQIMLIVYYIIHFVVWLMAVSNIL